MRRRAEAQTPQAEDELRAIIDNAPVSMQKMNARSLPELGRMADKLKRVPEKPRRS